MFGVEELVLVGPGPFIGEGDDIILIILTAD